VEQRSDEKQIGAGPEPLGADFFIPLLACGLTLYYLASTAELVWEAKATGTVIGAVLLALCTIHMGRLLLRIATKSGTFGFGDLFSDTLFNRQRLGLLVLVVLYIATIRWVGTTLGLFLLLIGCMWIMGVRSLRLLAGIAFATSAVVYIVLIRLLGSRLPQGPVEWLLQSVTGGG